MKVQIVVADDHPYFRKGIRDYLETLEEIDGIWEAGNGLEVLEILESQSIDLIILDAQMPTLDGYSTAVMAIERVPSIKVLIISDYGDELLVLSFIKAGVNGYILKSDAQLDKAIKLVLSNNFYFSKELQPIIIKAQKNLRNIDPIKVSSKDKKLLRLLSQGMNSREISEKLSLTKLTVETYRKNLLHKFGVSNTVQLIELAHRCGLL